MQKCSSNRTTSAPQVVTPNAHDADGALTADECVRRVASFLRTQNAYRRSKRVVRNMAEGYARCMFIAHRNLPDFDLSRAIALGMKRRLFRRSAT